MSIKTNKSFLKRLKVTKTGKVLGRVKGQNHFNSKESGSKRLAKGRKTNFPMSNKERSRFLVNF